MIVSNWVGGRVDTNYLPVADSRRRRHSADFKRKVVLACLQPGVSITSIALHNGLSVNLLRRWFKQHRDAQGLDAAPVVNGATVSASANGLPDPGFVALPGPAERRHSGDRIHVDLEHQGTGFSVSWPMGGVGVRDLAA